MDVYIETIGGTECLEIDYIQMEVYNEPQPPVITYYALIFFAFLFIAAIFILTVKLTKRGVKHHHS